VKRQEGKDETGHRFIRFFSKIEGPVYVAGSSEIKGESPDVMFQKIIYDGLVGHYFLRDYTVSYNIANSEMIFRKPKLRTP
jgi:hypothetical protein